MIEPEYIQWPGEGEFCRGRSWDGGSCCCLGGWARVSFFGDPRLVGSPDNPHYLAYAAFVRKLDDAANRRGFLGYVDLNDDGRVSDKTRAAVYAEAARARGYEECP